jgi:hypothetical protein
VGKSAFVVNPKRGLMRAQSLQKAATLLERDELDPKMVRQRILDKFCLSTPDCRDDEALERR